MNKIKYSLIVLIGLFLIACSGDVDNNRSYTPAQTQSSCDETIVKTFSTGATLTICYDFTYKSAKSVSYNLYGSLVNSLNISNRPSFYIEPQLPIGYQISSNDYIGSGYDRGHLDSVPFSSKNMDTDKYTILLYLA